MARTWPNRRPGERLYSSDHVDQLGRERRRQAGLDAERERMLEELRELAGRVRRLAPDRTTPETFYVERESIGDRLYALAGGAL